MRWIVTIPMLLAVALLSITTPALAAERVLELRVLEGVTITLSGPVTTAPSPVIYVPTPTVTVLDDRGVR